MGILSDQTLDLILGGDKGTVGLSVDIAGDCSATELDAARG